MMLIVMVVMGAAFALNGATMMLMPEYWFQSLPGIGETGAFNHHFVQDVGAAYLCVACAFFLARIYVHAGFPLLMTAFTFLGLHGLVHVADSLMGRMSWEHFASDVPTVMLPAIITLVFANAMRAFR